jgi:hypothetical protein
VGFDYGQRWVAAWHAPRSHSDDADLADTWDQARRRADGETVVGRR